MSLVPLDTDDFDAVLFDLDGVLTDSAALHARSWKMLFDAFLKDRDGDDFRPFDPDGDYRAYVDGKPRLDGIRSFLKSRAIDLAEGKEDDPPSALTVHGLGRRKNGFFLDALEKEGIKTFPAAIVAIAEGRSSIGCISRQASGTSERRATTRWAPASASASG